VGVLDFYRNWKKKRQDKAIASQAKVALNPKTLHEERAAAIDYLAHVDDLQKAVPLLLKRFDFSLDHGINDSREKDAAMEGVIKYGRDALAIVRDHLQQTPRIAWPLKIIQKIGTDQDVVESLEACLQFGDIEFDRNLVDRNYDLLCYLRDYPLADKGLKLLPYLKMHDERLRFAAVEVLLAQGDLNLIGQNLEIFIIDESAENTRLRQAVIENYLTHRWPLQSLDLAEGLIPRTNVMISSDRTMALADLGHQ
jgi:hypothetical protein